MTSTTVVEFDPTVEDRALLHQVRTVIDLPTRRLVEGMLEGVHLSVRTGRGFEFNDLREYVPGDDVKDVDWKASARHSGLLVRRHVAERRTTVLIAMAAGPGMLGLASPRQPKVRVGTLVAALFAQIALSHGDYVGGLWAAGPDLAGTRPTTRPVRVEAMLGQLARAPMPVGPSRRAARSDTSLDTVLTAAAGTARRRAVLVLICGDEDFDDARLRLLRDIADRHEVCVVVIDDLAATDPSVTDPSAGGVRGVDGSGTLLSQVLSDPSLAAELEQATARRRAVRETALAGLRIPTTHVRDVAEVPARVRIMLQEAARAH